VEILLQSSQTNVCLAIEYSTGPELEFAADAAKRLEWQEKVDAAPE